MDKLFYLFNPEHDMALANFTPYYRPPQEIICMREDLSCLPLWYAERGGVTGGIKEETADSFLSACMSSGIFPYGQVAFEWNGEVISPWGWDPALVHQLELEGISMDKCPDAEALNRIRFLSGRQQCIGVLNQLGRLEGICGKAVECLSVPEVKAWVHDTGETMLKSPWSGSGRGLLRVSPSTWNVNAEGWIARVIRTQGGIMAEPLYDKVCDFAMEFLADGHGRIRFAGYSLFDTDAHGNYKQNSLLPDEVIERRLMTYVPLQTLNAVKERLVAVLAALLKYDCAGYLGVDMMICREREMFLIHPCVEINLRMNMGVVSRLFFDRYVSGSSHGQYVVEHYAAKGEAINLHRKRSESYPLQVSQDGNILRGYLSLTPVQQNTRYQVYVLVEEANQTEYKEAGL